MYQSTGPIVLLRSDNNPRRQRFTAAHEIGHLLLGRVRDAGMLALDWKEEEKLCDAFATSLLLPEDETREFHDPAGGVSSPRTILEMASHFAVNLQPCVLALNRSWSDEHRMLIISERRGHPRRPDEIDFRVAASAGNPLELVARNTRLSSIGLEGVSEWAAAVGSGEGRGTCASMRMPFWAPSRARRSGIIEGKSSWEAVCLRNGVLIVLVDLSEASVKWSGRGLTSVEDDASAG
jgi:hypothetical protein